MSRTFIDGKNKQSAYYTYTMDDNRIGVFNFSNNIHFILYQSLYTNIKLAGKIIWFALDRFTATIAGEEGLMLADFTVDRELISCLNKV